MRIFLFFTPIITILISEVVRHPGRRYKHHAIMRKQCKRQPLSRCVWMVIFAYNKYDERKIQRKKILKKKKIYEVRYTSALQQCMRVLNNLFTELELTLMGIRV